MTTESSTKRFQRQTHSHIHTCMYAQAATNTMMSGASTSASHTFMPPLHALLTVLVCMVGAGLAAVLGFGIGGGGGGGAGGRAAMQLPWGSSNGEGTTAVDQEGGKRGGGKGRRVVERQAKQGGQCF